jgi:hypothetical protein
MIQIISGIVGKLGGKIVDTLDNRNKRKQEVTVQKLQNVESKANRQAEIAKQRATATLEGRKMDATWEELAWKNSGWKDEFWTVLFGALLVAGCVPLAAPYVFAGVASWSTWPVEFKFMLGALVLSSIGIRWKGV